ncbi:basal body-orientation factor 1-like isoform X3 [Babylonia areolata]
MAAANSQMWEARLDISERAKQDYRESAKKLMLENDALQSQMLATERDTIDVITFLKKQDREKDGQLEHFQNQIRELRKEQRQEKEALVEDFSKQINDLEEKLGEKVREVELMQSELKTVKEFRRKRGLMQKELDEIKESMHNANRDHKATLARLEQKFFEEKMRLQQEANQKIAELAEKAHTEAIANLDETTKAVYKENMRLSESLTFHMKEGDELKKEREHLTEQNKHLMGEKEVNDMMVQEKVIQAKQQKEHIRELHDKVRMLEKTLSHIVREFETERQMITESARAESEAARKELAKLQRVIETKTKEMNKVKRLAKSILDQRTELERFFLESLELVKQEIAANQTQYRRDAQAAYQQKMLAAHSGKGDYPKIRTFTKAENSTNSVFKDIEAAERLCGVTGQVDIADLTWEQKERVLRFLFARMNGSPQSPSSPSASTTTLPKQAALPPITSQPAGARAKATDDDSSHTFLTQADLLAAEHPAVPNLAEVMATAALQAQES